MGKHTPGTSVQDTAGNGPVRGQISDRLRGVIAATEHGDDDRSSTGANDRYSDARNRRQK